MQVFLGKFEKILKLHHQTMERNMLKKSLEKPQKVLQSFPTYDIIIYVIKGNARRAGKSSGHGGNIMEKLVSINNGKTFETAAEAMPEIMARVLWNALVNVMDDDTREEVAAELAPCTEKEFLERYLAMAPADLVIG